MHRPYYFLLCLLLLSTPALGEEGRPVADVDPEREINFDDDVLPILRKNCLACHNKSETEGELIMESASSIADGGDSGPTVVPGNANESLLFQLASHQTEPIMPPVDNDVGAKPLSAESLGIIRLWINQGAKADQVTTQDVIQWKPVPREIAPVFALEVSADGHLVVVGRGNEIVAHDASSKQEVARLSDPAIQTTHPGAAHLDIVQSLAISSDQNTIVSGGFRCIKIWQRSPLQDEAQIGVGSRAVTITTAGNLVVSRDETVVLLAPDGQEMASLPIATVATSQIGTDELAAIDSAGTIHVLSLTDLSTKQEWDAKRDNTKSPILVTGTETFVAAGFADGKVRIWPRDQGTISAAGDKQLEHGSELTHLVAIPRVSQLLSGSADGKLRFWNADGTSVGQIEVGGEIANLVCSNDGSRCVTISTEGLAKLWDLQNRKLVREIATDVFAQSELDSAARQVGLRKERHRVSVEDVEAAKKRKEDDEKNAKKTIEELVKANEDVPKKKDALAKATEAVVKPKEAFDAAEAIVKDHQTAIIGFDETLKTATDDAAKNAIADDKEKRQAELKRSEEDLATKKKELEKVQAAETKATQDLEAAEKAVKLAEDAKSRGETAVAKRTEELAAAEVEAAMFKSRLTSVEENAESIKRQAAEDLATFIAVAFFNNSELLLQDRQRRVARLTASTGKVLETIEAMSGELFGCQSDVAYFKKDDSVTGTHVGRSWKLTKVIGDHGTDATFVDRVTSLAFNDDDTILATGGGEPSRSGEVKLWDTSDWSLVASVEDVHSDVVYDLGFSPQGGQLASCGSDRMMKLIDVSTAQTIRSFEGHTGHVLGVGWRADGRTVATAGADKVVKVWDAKEGTQKKTVSGFKKEVTAIAFMGLEDRFVLGGGDGTVESRNSNGDGRSAFAGFSDFVHQVRSSRNGEVIAAAGQDGAVRVWDKDGKLIAEFKR